MGRIGEINLYDRIVQNKTSALPKGKLQEAIDLKDVAHGIYTVQVIVNGNVFINPIVK